MVAKKSAKKQLKEKKSKEIDFEIEGGNDDLGGEISVSFDDEPESVKKAHDEEIKHLKVKASKPVSSVKKGDKIKVDNLNLEVDSHYVLIDHGKTKEMAIELFDSKTDKDYQLRYFSDQVETSMEFYELDEIVYNRKDADKVEW